MIPQTGHLYVSFYFKNYCVFVDKTTCISTKYVKRRNNGLSLSSCPYAARQTPLTKIGRKQILGTSNRGLSNVISISKETSVHFHILSKIGYVRKSVP
jgi:hypothetical protein